MPLLQSFQSVFYCFDRCISRPEKKKKKKSKWKKKQKLKNQSSSTTNPKNKRIKPRNSERSMKTLNTKTLNIKAATTSKNYIIALGFLGCFARLNLGSYCSRNYLRLWWRRKGEYKRPKILINNSKSLVFDLPQKFINTRVCLGKGT